MTTTIALSAVGIAVLSIFLWLIIRYAKKAAKYEDKIQNLNECLDLLGKSKQISENLDKKSPEEVKKIFQQKYIKRR